MPPAPATAIESDGGQAPAIGASNSGTRSPNRAQNSSTRLRMDLFMPHHGTFANSP